MKKENLDKVYKFADNAVNTLDGVFGLVIGMFSGYIGATLGCKTQYHLDKNMFFETSGVNICHFNGCCWFREEKITSSDVSSKSINNMGNINDVQ